MPLLRRQPFVPNPAPPDLQANDEVFYCPLTKEVFKDFEAFFERTILCNSLLWSCSLTGKTNLTFQEAIDSEKRALQTVNDIPYELKQPLLYIASLTCRGKVNDACDDVYYFMKDRYFVHEHLEAILRGKWYPAKILRVVPPTAPELQKYKEEKDEDLSTDDKLQLLNQYGPPPELLKYEVRELLGDDEGAAGPIHLVTVDCVRREKRLYSREKVRLYLRHCMEFDEFQGIWVVKAEAWKKLEMEPITYADIFIAGPRPSFEVSRAVKRVSRQPSAPTSKGADTPKTPSRVNGNSTPVKGTPKRASQSAPNSKSATKSPKMDAEALAKEFIKIREERESLRQFADRRKQQKIEEKQLAKEKKKEEKRAMAEYVKEWSKQRDDLECDDLKDLPIPIPVQCRIPNGLFGDFLMVLEFFHCFGEELQLKDNFPAGLTFDLLERAVFENEVSGPLSDIIQVLLSSLFEYQDAEAEEVKEANSGDQQDQEVTESGPTYQGTPLKKLSMDSLTVSEVLRLHLVSSGGRSSELRSKWRYQQRGGYSSADDPGVQLREEDPHILHTLATNTVYELPIGDKLKVIKCLCHQILTYASIRDVLEEKSSRLLQIRQELRALHSNERRMRREDAAKKAKIRASEENGNTEGGESQTSTVTSSAEMDELDKECAKRRAEYIKKEQQLRLQATRLQSMTHFMPLGQDRAFRRFWVFESCPGLFVEDDDDFVGACLSHPTPTSPQKTVNDSHMNKEDIRSFFKASNKENQVVGSENTTEKGKLFGVCTANPSDCPVHATYIPRTKWSFFENVDTVDKLLLSLNERGFRESALKNILLQDKERISESIQKCSVHRLDHSKPDIQQINEVRKSTRQTRKEKEYDINMHFPAGTPIEQIFERTFVDMILETEEKIFVGGLGALKVKDRNAWRQALENGKYDSLVGSVTWGGKLETKPRVKSESLDADEEDNGSVISSSADGETLTSVVAKKNVMDMSTALLQLAQSVETKYLRKPLGEDEKEKKKRLKAEEALKKWEDGADSSKVEPKVLKTPLEKWELSLHACTSFSQLYVHLALLDNSITWNRSALNARCRICRRKGDAEKMLLCDGCDKGHHMYCLRPPLTVVPDGDWFCYECKPREKPRTPRKTRRVFSEVSDDEDQEEEEEEAAEAEEEAEAEEGESESESIHNETCAVCQEGGNVLCCDTCPAVYHLECVNPPLRKVPRGKWSCPQCKTPPQEKERVKLREKNSDGRTSSSRSTRARQILDFDDHDKEDIKYPVTRQRTQTDPIRLKSSPELTHGKRRSAAEAVDKIAQATKRLRGESYDDESSGGSDNHKWNGPPRNRRTRPLPLPSSSVDAGAVDMGDLEHLVSDLMKHPESWPFRKPVTKSEAPDYHRVIKHAMDLGTIKYKLSTVKYHNTEEFLGDLHLIFQNCYTYNSESADEYKCGRNLNKFAEQRLKQLGFNKGIENSG